MTIRVAFEDGSDRVDYWDGRDRSKRFVYESASLVRWASVDPDEVLLLDTTGRNNTRMRIPDAPSAATRWAPDGRFAGGSAADQRVPDVTFS